MTDTPTDPEGTQQAAAPAFTPASTPESDARGMAERVQALVMSASILSALEARAEGVLEGSLPLDAGLALSDQLEARIDEARAAIAREVQAMAADGDLDTISQYLAAAPAVEAALDQLSHLTMLRAIEGARANG